MMAQFKHYFIKTNKKLYLYLIWNKKNVIYTQINLLKNANFNNFSKKYYQFLKESGFVKN